MTSKGPGSGPDRPSWRTTWSRSARWRPDRPPNRDQQPRRSRPQRASPAPEAYFRSKYLAERQPMLDHTTLRDLAFSLGALFWRDLEHHHPGTSSLQLAPEVAAAWKQRVL